MIAEGGHAALWLAAAFALLATWAQAVFAYKTRSSRAKSRDARPLSASLDFARDERPIITPALIISALFAFTAFLALAWSFLAADVSLILVDDRVHRLQPPLVRLAMLLGSPAGWLLLAAALVAALGALTPRLAPVAFAALAAVLVLDPFARQPLVPPEGRALTLPVDLAAALAGPPLAALAIALLLAVLLHGPIGRPPRWMVLAGGAAVLLGAAGVAASQFGKEATAVLHTGKSLRLHGAEARLVALTPTAGPGYTAIEAEIAIDGATLRPEARTLLYASEETAVPASTRSGLGRIEATLGPARGAEREVTLRWTPL